MTHKKFSSDDLILVTGSGSGIGKSVSLSLNETGARVVGISRNETNLAKVKKECKHPENFFFETVDLSKDVDKINLIVKDLVQKYGKFSGFVHSAGNLNPQPLKVLDYNDCLHDFNINLFSAMMLTKGLCSKRNRQDALKIVYVSSIAAKIGNPGSLSYAMTKASLNSMVTTLAQENPNIHVNSVMPGGVDTAMSAGYNESLSYDYLEKVKAKTSLNEIAKPQYIADVILFLLSSESHWIQGQNIIVDGGESLS